MVFEIDTLFKIYESEYFKMMNEIRGIALKDAEEARDQERKEKQSKLASEQKLTVRKQMKNNSLMTKVDNLTSEVGGLATEIGSLKTEVGTLSVSVEQVRKELADQLEP